MPQARPHVSSHTTHTSPPVIKGGLRKGAEASKAAMPFKGYNLPVDRFVLEEGQDFCLRKLADVVSKNSNRCL